MIDQQSYLIVDIRYFDHFVGKREVINYALFRKFNIVGFFLEILVS
jgi:hypothetical protein